MTQWCPYCGRLLSGDICPAHGYVGHSEESNTGVGYSANSATTFPGEIRMYGGDTAPSGWLLCQGQAISRTVYSTLFGIIGTKYGVGDGSTTFNVPNMEGRVPAGMQHDDTDFHELGHYAGEKSHQLSAAELPVHQHDYVCTPAGGSTASSAVQGGSGTPTYNNYTGNIGSNTAHNIMQPYLCLNFIIKA